MTKVKRYFLKIPTLTGRITAPVTMHEGIASGAEFDGDEFIIVAKDGKALRKAWKRVFLDEHPMDTNKTRRVVVTRRSYVTT